MLLALQPEIDERLCIACGDCVRTCPTACLRIVRHLPVITAERLCISCTLCEIVCPVQAIRMVPRASAAVISGQK